MTETQLRRVGLALVPPPDRTVLMHAPPFGDWQRFRFVGDHAKDNFRVALARQALYGEEGHFPRIRADLPGPEMHYAFGRLEEGEELEFWFMKDDSDDVDVYVRKRVRDLFGPAMFSSSKAVVMLPQVTIDYLVKVLGAVATAGPYGIKMYEYDGVYLCPHPNYTVAEFRQTCYVTDRLSCFFGAVRWNES